jgi:hypothetical protein
MGGTVAVCVRHPDGNVDCGHAWTGSLSSFHHEPAFLDDVDTWLRSVPIDPDLGRGSIAPAGYGLVFYDRMTHTIVSMNSHAIPGSKSVAFLHLLHGVGGYEDELPAWEALNARGLLSVGPWFRADAERVTIDPGHTILEQLPGLSDRDQVTVDMRPWRIVPVESDRQDLEKALRDIGVTIPSSALRDWDDHFSGE